MDEPRSRLRGARFAWMLVAALLVAGALLWAFAARFRTTTEAPPAPPTIALVVWDSVAIDHLQPWGYAHATTPHLSRLAQESLLFEQHFPSTNGTNAAFATLLTGRLARDHGVGRLDAVRAAFCAPQVPTLAEMLSEHGYRGIASLALPQLAPQLSGLDRGFEQCAAPSLAPLEVERSARDTLAAVRPALEELLAARAPVFVVLHLADVRAVHLERAQGAQRWVGERLAPFAASMPEVDAALRALPQDPAGALAQLSQHLLRRRSDPARAAYVAALYDAAVTAMDEALGELLSALDRHGRGQDALIVVCGARAGGWPISADGTPASEPAARHRAPLLLRLPGGSASGRSTAITQDVDLLPTVLSVAGFASPAGSVGNDLTATVPGLPRAAAFFEDERFELRAAIGPDWMQLESLEAGPRSVARHAAPPAPATPSELELAELTDLLERHPPLGRLRLKAFDQPATRVVVRGALLAPLEPGGRNAGSQAFELSDSRGAGTPWNSLRARHAAPDLALEFACDDGIDEGRVHIGGASLRELDLGLLADPRAPEWPADVDQAARCVIDYQAGGWSQVALGRAPASAARAVVELFPAAPESVAEAVESGPEVRRSAHPRRPGALVLEGASPLLFRVRKRPSSELALAFFLDGERVPAAEIRRDGRRFSTPGTLILCLSAAAWSDPELYTPASAVAGVHIELLDSPPLAPVEAPPSALHAVIKSLASRE